MRNKLKRNRLLISELAEADQWIEAQSDKLRDWHRLSEFAAKNWSFETQEMLHSIALETYPEMIIELENHCTAIPNLELDASMTTTQLREIIEHRYDWALAIDFSEASASDAFWYRSEEKLEPRLGFVGADPGIEKQMPLPVGRRVRQCFDLLLEDIENPSAQRRYSLPVTSTGTKKYRAPNSDPG